MCSIAEIHLISNQGEAIAIRAIALWITDFFIATSNVSGFFPGPRQYFNLHKNSCNFYGIFIQESNCQICLQPELVLDRLIVRIFLLSNTVPNLKFLNPSCNSIAFSMHISENPDLFLFLQNFLLMIYTTIEWGA